MNLDAANFCRRARAWLRNAGSSLRPSPSFQSSRPSGIGKGTPNPRLRRKRRYIRWLVAALAVVLSIVGVGLVLLAPHWPFTEQAVAADLRARIADTVEIGSFRKQYFPHPGCVAESV